MVPGYAELHCVSNYSFLRGASDPDELVPRRLLDDGPERAGAVHADVGGIPAQGDLGPLVAGEVIGAEGACVAHPEDAAAIAREARGLR